MIRRIAAWLVTYLTHRFNIALVAESRIANGTDKVARGQRYEAFYLEEDGLRDMFTALRRDYFEKVGDVKPGDTDSLKALAMADKIAREIERKFQTVIETGKIYGNDTRHTQKIANIR